MKMKRKPYPKSMLALCLVLLAVFIALPLAVNQPYIQHIFVLTFYMATASMAWSILGGMTGQNSLGHAAFMAMGAYFSSLLILKLEMNTWLTLPIAMLGTGIIAVIVFYPCFILRGPYFTLVTIALGETFRNFMINWEFGGRNNGLLLPFGDDSWGFFRFFDKIPYYYVGLAMLLIVYLIIRKIDRSKLGFALKTIREDEDVASTIGIYPTKYKLIAVFISTMIVAMAGFFYAQYIRYIDPAIALQTYSVEFVLPAIIGGIQFVNGPIVGSLILVPLSEFLRAQFGNTLPGINLIVYAIVMILIIRFMPTGLLGWLSGSKLKKRLDAIMKRDGKGPELIDGGGETENE